MYEANILLKLMDVWNVYLKTWQSGKCRVCNANGMVKISEE